VARVALLQRWAGGVRALDGADARAAGVLREVAATLGRIELEVPAASGAPAGPARGGRGIFGRAVDAVLDVAAGTVNTQASLANAVGRHPADVAQLAAGLALGALGATGEGAGAALDTTMVGAPAGTVVGAASTATTLAGLGLAGGAAARLGAHAATDDRVAPLRMSGGPEPPGAAPSAGPGGRVDIAGARYAQRTASRRFSRQGFFRGRLVEDVAADLRAGRLQPRDVPVNVVTRDGQTLILNTRSALALQEAGVPRSSWHVVDRTAQQQFERRLTRQLLGNDLDPTGTDLVIWGND